MNFPLIPVLVVTTTLAVVGAWWLLKAPAPKPDESAAPVHATSKAKTIAVQKAEEPIKLVADATGLSPAEFSRMMQNLVDDASTEERKAAQAGLTATCNLEQAVVFYSAARLKVKGKVDPGALRGFLGAMGGRFRAIAMAEFLKQHPKGDVAMDSILHGWAKVQSQEALNWFQSLPETFPSRQAMLQAVLWGMSTANAKNGLAAYRTMSVADQNSTSAIYGLSNGLVQNSGLQGLNLLLAEVNDPLVFTKILQASLGRASKQPPELFVPWMADYVELDAKLAESWQAAAKEWQSKAPDKFAEWFREGKSRLPPALQQALAL